MMPYGISILILSATSSLDAFRIILISFSKLNIHYYINKTTLSDNTFMKLTVNIFTFH